MSQPKDMRAGLTPLEERVMFGGGTEAPFSGVLDVEFRAGTYYCNNCHTRLFGSDSKFDSGCGWPSFTNPTSADSIELVNDTSHGMIRTEVRCAKCHAHLGHVFPDGPQDRGGLRYCINSASLSFTQKK